MQHGPEVELRPVRPRGGLARDRGALVAVGIVILILVGVLKPWSSGPQQEPPVAIKDVEGENRSAGADETPAGEAPTTQRPPRPHPGSFVPATAPGTGTPPQPPPQAQQSLTLADVRALAAKPGEQHEVFSALIATTSDSARVAFRGDLPTTRELGQACTGGAMLSEGSDAVGLTTATLPVTGHEVVRLFEEGDAVPISATQAEGAADGFILRPKSDGGLPVGHYALIVRAYGDLRVAPFCVGRKVIVDAWLIKYVPPYASRAGARDVLLDSGSGRGGDTCTRKRNAWSK